MEEDREEPREYDIDMFTVACTDAVLESLEELQLKVEEIQLSCEEYATRNADLQQRLIDKENELTMTRTQLEEQITHLKKINLQILAQKFLKDNNMQKWVKFATDMVDKEQETHGLESKVDKLTIKCMEKDKLISSLEWQLKDKEASLATTTADRNRLATEVDELALRLDELEFVEALHRQESIRSKHDGPSFDSDDESMGSKRNSARLGNHLQNEEDDGRLRRAANFTNINSLNLSSDFSIEKVVTGETPHTLGQGDLSKSDNMLSKDICRSLNRIYELRDDSRYFSQSNNCIDRQTRLRSSLTERRRTGVEPADILTVQTKAVESRKPRVYVNGDYCEEMKSPKPTKVWSSPAPRRKDRIINITRNLHGEDQSKNSQYVEKYQSSKDSEMVSNETEQDSTEVKKVEDEKNKETPSIDSYTGWNGQENEDSSQSDIQISLC